MQKSSRLRRYGHKVQIDWNFVPSSKRFEFPLEGTSTQLAASVINLTREEKQELCDFFHRAKVPSK